MSKKQYIVNYFQDGVGAQTKWFDDIEKAILYWGECRDGDIAADIFTVMPYDFDEASCVLDVFPWDRIDNRVKFVVRSGIYVWGFANIPSYEKDSWGYSGFSKMISDVYLPQWWWRLPERETLITRPEVTP